MPRNTAGHGHEPGYQRDCEQCRRAAREDKQAQRDRRRGLTESPALTVIDGEAPQRGRVELAVEAELHALGIDPSANAVAAGALVLAAGLDNRLMGTSHPSMARILRQSMEALKKNAAPKRGRLAAVQDMSKRG